MDISPMQALDEFLDTSQAPVRETETPESELRPQVYDSDGSSTHLSSYGYSDFEDCYATQMHDAMLTPMKQTRALYMSQYLEPRPMLQKTQMMPMMGAQYPTQYVHPQQPLAIHAPVLVPMPRSPTPATPTTVSSDGLADVVEVPASPDDKRREGNRKAAAKSRKKKADAMIAEVEKNAMLSAQVAALEEENSKLVGMLREYGVSLEAVLC